eukprot:TRINITY_DN74192_c0_g1_i1.p1 TRINITY_DN74192_c0_g1~~TRINITY_DN74192_c0_g1_i1.p1  ORF type:complete len:473 (-),score=122.41 TRINITY_DN74192_c0_g1_i1:98-1516(-)
MEYRQRGQDPSFAFVNDVVTAAADLAKFVQGGFMRVCVGKPPSKSAQVIGPPPLPVRRAVKEAMKRAAQAQAAYQNGVSDLVDGERQWTGIEAESTTTPMDIADMAEEASSAAASAAEETWARAEAYQQQLLPLEEANQWRYWSRALVLAPAECWDPEAEMLELPDPQVDMPGTPGSRQEEEDVAYALPPPDVAGDEKIPMSPSKRPMVRVTLPLPGRSLKENAEACMANATKIEHSNSRIAPLAQEAEEEAQQWDEMSNVLKATQEAAQRAGYDPHAEALVRRLHEELCLAGRIRRQPGRSQDSPRKEEEEPQEPNSPVREGKKTERKYGKDVDCFVSPSGHEVVCGRDSSGNEKVSFHLTPKNAFWLHVGGGIQGAHVAILCPASEVSTLEDVEFAAAIAAHHSKARDNISAEVTYCYGLQLARPGPSAHNVVSQMGTTQTRDLTKQGLVRIRGERGNLRVIPGLPKQSA